MDADEARNLEQKYNDELKGELAQLHAYRQALAEEFASLDPDDPTTAAAARRVVVENVPQAGGTLKWLMEHSESDSVRLSAAKFVFQMAISQAKDDSADDELTKLMKKLRGEDKVAA